MASPFVPRTKDQRAKPDDSRRAEDAAVRYWTGLAYSIADRYFIPGADMDDARQEALVGLLAALRTWDAAKGTLRSFVGLCVERRVITAVKLAQAQKHSPLNSSLRAVTSEDGGSMDAVDLAAPSALGRDPHLVAVENEEIRELGERARTLTAMERRAVGGLASGYSYCEIEGIPAGEKPKWIDNAVQRARKKLAA